MVDDKIHDDFDLFFVGFFKQLFEIFKRSVVGIDLVVVGNVVAVVNKRGNIDRIQPQDVDAKLFKIRQFFDDALDVADSVVVRIVEALRINLIDDAFFPPIAHYSSSSSSSVCKNLSLT